MSLSSSEVTKNYFVLNISELKIVLIVHKILWYFASAARISMHTNSVCYCAKIISKLCLDCLKVQKFWKSVVVPDCQ